MSARVDALDPFDALAGDYDAGFSHTFIGGLMRARMWRLLDRCFSPGDRLLELNCGTGEDALHLASRGLRVLATDASAGMVEVTRRKLAAAGLDTRVSVQRLAVESLAGLDAPAFDAVLSNFGGLNCVADIDGFSASLASKVRPGGTVVLCLMGPLVPWEWCWFVLHGEPRKALRRLRRGGVAWRGLQIRYPSIARVRASLAPWFRCRRVSALGALLPPPYVERWAVRHARLVRALDRIESRVEAFAPLPWLADHYVVTLTRRRASARAGGSPGTRS